MNQNAKTGVFLCQCGDKIAPLVDLEALQNTIKQDGNVAHCEVLSYPCLRPGLDRITEAVTGEKLNRVVIAGCEGRLMLRKFEQELGGLALGKGQVDMVNLRDHVAAVSDLTPQEKAGKGGKLISAAAAEMGALSPTAEQIADVRGPVMILGGGIAAYTAAQELARKDVDFILAPSYADPVQAFETVHRTYPGDRAGHTRLKTAIQEVLASPRGTILPPSRLLDLAGITGNFNLQLAPVDGGEERTVKAGAIITCIDADLTPPGPSFGHDGQTVLTQPEMDEAILQTGVPEGRVVFWISDHENGQPEFAGLSARSAWDTACHIRKNSRTAQVIILYNHQMEIPLLAAERRVNRELGIQWIPYDNALSPSVQDHYITFCTLDDHLESEAGWDLLVLSPMRGVRSETRQYAELLGLTPHKAPFLSGHHARVRPEMVGQEETFLAGSGRLPCSLSDAMNQGWRAAKKTVELFEKSAAGELRIPRVVSLVDPAKCIGCGQCQELCECGGMGIEPGAAGGRKRVVDPLLCTGGGTCAAACPYNAITLKNTTTDQREARVAALARQLAGDEVLACGCSWAGLPAADNAGLKGLKYDPRLHLLGVPCVGQIDPCIMARAFLEGASGLILIGCMPEDCHHSFGIDHAWSRVNVIKKLFTLCGIDRRRIALAHADLNRPEDFVRTVDGFTHTVGALGPIEKSPHTFQQLEAIYHLMKYNTRVRHLISAGLRRPWEDGFRGDQQHALDYDRDFTAVLAEEFLQQRILQILRKEQRNFKLEEVAAAMQENEQSVADALWGMVTEGMVGFSHQNREAVYGLKH